MQDIDEVLTRLTQQNCHPEAGKRSANMYKQKVMHALINNRIVDYDKLSPETQSRIALVIVQGSIAPIRLVILKDLKSRLHADLGNARQNDLTVESAFELMLAREQAIAAGESSIAVFLKKWFEGEMRLNCDDRADSYEDESARLLPTSKAPSVVPKASFGGSDPDSKEPSREEQIELIIKYYVMTNYGHYQSANIRWSPKESQAATCNKRCSKRGQLHLISAGGWRGHEYNVDVVVNGKTIRCICPSESCDAFAERTGLKPNLERAAKIREHHGEYKRQKRGDRREPSRAHAGAKQPQVGVAAGDKTGREAAKPLPVPPVIPVAPVTYVPKGNLNGGSRSHVTALQPQLWRAKNARANSTAINHAFFTVSRYAECEAGSANDNSFNEIGNDSDGMAVVRELEQRCAHLSAELAAEKRNGPQGVQYNNVGVLCWGQVLMIKDDRTLSRRSILISRYERTSCLTQVRI